MNIPNELLRHIPCPNGDACVSVRCLFGHTGDKRKGILAPELSSPSSLYSSANGGRGSAARPVGSDHQAAAAATQHRPEFGYDGSHTDKRIKAVHSGHDYGHGHRHGQTPPPVPQSKTAHSPPGQQGASAGGHPSGIPDAHSTMAALVGRPKSISPPPLKRKREEPTGGHARPGSAVQTPTTNAGTSTTTAATAAAATAADAVASADTTAKSKKLLPQPKRKPETLNPRFVVKAPAKHEIRLRLLKLLHQEFSRLNRLLFASKDRPEERKQYLLTPQGVIWAALDIEERYATSKSSTIYSDTIKHRIMEYKRMTVSQWVKERKEMKEKARKEHQNFIASAPPTSATKNTKTPTGADGSGNTAGDSATATATTIAATAAADSPPQPIVTGLPPGQEFVLLKTHFLTPIDKLANHGYVPTVPSPADIQKARDADEVSKGWEQCERCTRRFQVFPGRREEDGALTSGGECQYHPGRLNKSTQVFSCCSESADGSKGCEKSASHVFKISNPKRLASLWNFAETPANSHVPVDQAVCFDCEMAYTVYGMEVVRLTVTAWPGGELLLDVLVRPNGAIIDLNSRFSGVWPKDFANAAPYGSGTLAKGVLLPQALETKEGSKPTDTPADRPPLPLVASPEAARSLFHSLIRPETVLIGHALENDLNTMRMVHSRLADTVLLFPHPRGLPYRYSLRALAKDHMDRMVQTAILAGHDSAEDARVAGDLVRTKIKAKWADMRLRGWKLTDGTMSLDA